MENMNDHLSQEQVAGWMLGMHDDVVSQHLRICAGCRAEVEELEDAVSRFRQSIHAAARREEPFWSKERIAIGERLAASRPVPFLRWIPVMVMAAVVFIAVLVMRAPRTPPPPAKDDAGEALLLEVQRTVRREYPEALAPAVLIAEERNEILTGETKQPQDSLKNRRQEK